jgi:hypothetical protein
MEDQNIENYVTLEQLQAFSKDAASAFLTGITAAFGGIQTAWQTATLPLEIRQQSLVNAFENEYRSYSSWAIAYADGQRSIGNAGIAAVADKWAASYAQKANALLDPLVAASEKLAGLNAQWSSTLEPLLSKAPSVGGALARNAGPIGDALNTIDAWMETLATGDTKKLADVSFAIITAEVVGGFVIAFGVFVALPLVPVAIGAGILAAGAAWAVEKLGTGSSVIGDFNEFVSWVFDPTNKQAIARFVCTTFFGACSAPRSDPLTLDLDGDGIETAGINVAAPVMFDISGTGIQQSVGWIKPDDGFLVRDMNGNGLIDSGAELFGDATTLTSGQKAADGFAALAVSCSHQDHEVALPSLDFLFPCSRAGAGAGHASHANRTHRRLTHHDLLWAVPWRAPFRQSQQARRPALPSPSRADHPHLA